MNYAEQGLSDIARMRATAVHVPPVVSPPLAMATAPTKTGALDNGQLAWGMLSTAGAVMGTYHGYKRNHGSVGWTIGWFFFGAIVPIAAIPVMLAQGFGKGGGGR